LEQIYTKNYKISRFRGFQPIFYSHDDEILREGARTLDSLSLSLDSKFCKKKSLEGIGPLGEDVHHKILYFDDLADFSPHFESHDGEILA